MVAGWLRRGVALVRGRRYFVKGIPVLMYHAIQDDEHPAGLKESGAQLYTVQTGIFRDQMRYLHRQGFRAILLDEIPGLVLNERSVVLTFDDGHRSNITLALPILQEFGFHAEFFVTTGWIGRPNFLTPEDIRHLGRNGMGVGSHGANHVFLDELSESEAVQELVSSRATLTQLTQRPVQWFSAPGGRLRPRLELLAAQAGFRGVCTSAPGLFRPDPLRTRVPRLTVRGTTSLQDFARLVHQPPLTRAWAATRYSTLEGVKHYVGNDRYARIHAWVSKVAGSRTSGVS